MHTFYASHVCLLVVLYWSMCLIPMDPPQIAHHASYSMLSTSYHYPLHTLLLSTELLLSYTQARVGSTTSDDIVWLVLSHAVLSHSRWGHIWWYSSAAEGLTILVPISCPFGYPLRGFVPRLGPLVEEFFVVWLSSPCCGMSMMLLH